MSPYRNHGGGHKLLPLSLVYSTLSPEALIWILQILLTDGSYLYFILRGCSYLFVCLFIFISCLMFKPAVMSVVVLTGAVLDGRAQVSPVFLQLCETVTNLLLSFHQLFHFRLEPLSVRFHSVLPVFILIHTCWVGKYLE